MTCRVFCISNKVKVKVEVEVEVEVEHYLNANDSCEKRLAINLLGGSKSRHCKSVTHNDRRPSNPSKDFFFSSVMPFPDMFLKHSISYYGSELR